MAWLLIFREFFSLVLSKVWNSTKESSKPNKRHSFSGESTLILRKKGEKHPFKKRTPPEGGKFLGTHIHTHKLSYGKLSVKVTFFVFYYYLSPYATIYYRPPAIENDEI